MSAFLNRQNSTLRGLWCATRLSGWLLIFNHMDETLLLQSVDKKKVADPDWWKFKERFFLNRTGRAWLLLIGQAE
ncbi:MAG: hypothetical protein A2096_12535 [Spirochaetes bacterium GWF1_41_5]|nr:MAG: hypothetical protein A2096_12535 [Spirochaetes bacterium GWF1_41_5]